MALILAGKPDPGPEYRSIHDILAVNISKLIITQAADSGKGTPDGSDIPEIRTGKAIEDHAWKVKVDFSSVSAFVIPAHGTAQWIPKHIRFHVVLHSDPHYNPCLFY
jgi:hypothetical protein